MFTNLSLARLGMQKTNSTLDLLIDPPASTLTMHSATSYDHAQPEWQPTKHSLLLLPTEIHDSIISFLPYPDLLALKHTHPHFYRIVVTTKHQRTNWLSERAEQRLPLPQRTCRWNTDADFCRSEEIREFMKRRRWHLDCPGKKSGGGCLVIEGKDCSSIRVRNVRKWYGALAADVVFGRGKSLPWPARRNRASDMMLALAVVIVIPVAFALWFLSDHLAAGYVLLGSLRT
jgi:hypothetical protein